MVPALTIISGVATSAFGIYFFIEKGEFGSALGAVFAATGLMVTTFVIVSALVPGFFS